MSVDERELETVIRRLGEDAWGTEKRQRDLLPGSKSFPMPVGIGAAMCAIRALEGTGAYDVMAAFYKPNWPSGNNIWQ